MELPATSTKLMVKKAGNIADPFQGFLGWRQALFRKLLLRAWAVFDPPCFNPISRLARQVCIHSDMNPFLAKSVRFHFGQVLAQSVLTSICSEPGFLRIYTWTSTARF